MQIVFLIFLFVLGSCIGSFLCCMARRLHFEVLNESETNSKSKSNSNPQSKSKSIKSKKAKTKKPNKSLSNRSVCLECHYQLKWYDNIPIISWLFLRGRCRKCHKPIGLAEINSEIGVGLAFVGLGWTLDISTATCFNWILFIVTILFAINLAFLAIYDGLYGELPTMCLFTAILLGLGVLIIEQIVFLAIMPFSFSIIILDPLASVLILGGLYLVLYLASKGRWVGDGDWLLGTAIGLALANPWLAIIALCLANILALLYALPTIKKSKTHKIHFGPFMVAAFFIVATFSDFLLQFIQ